MEIPSTTYPAKILLVGEYSIIHGSDALIIPYNKLYGHWQNNTSSEYNLNPFLDYISTLSGCIKPKLDHLRKAAWHFYSSIPIGYGAGSSGALTAAIYDFVFNPASSLIETKNKLAEIESFFHGSSSGMDPLASYLKKPLHIRDGEINVLTAFQSPSDIYLYDSQKTRKSKPLIGHYKKMRKADPSFLAITKALSDFNSQIISEIINKQDYSSTFREISSIQFQYFDKMIPADLKPIWQKGLEDDSYYFKLSGAGGGGYFLVYSRDKNSLRGLESI